MKLKYSIIIFILVFFTACSVEYDINIDDNVKEKFQIYEDNNEKISNDIYGGKYANSLPFDVRLAQIIDYPQAVLSNQIVDIYDLKNEIEGTIYYKKDLIDEEQKYGINMETEFNLIDLPYLKSVRQCYAKFNVDIEEDKLSIFTSEENLCFENYPILDKININLNINFKEDFEVVENNATIVDGNKYTWVIDKNNYKNQPINIVVDRMPENNKKENISIILLIVCGIVLAIGGIIFLFFGIRNRRINKI